MHQVLFLHTRYQVTSFYRSIYVVTVIGFNQTVYTFGEGDGTVEVCAVFLEPRDPSRIAPNVVVELMGSTLPSTYSGCCVNVYSLHAIV